MINGYLADVLLPTHEVHLLGGPSGAGKTRWLLHQLLLWEQGEDFLGFKSHPAPWVYVAADRSIASVARTLSGMGIDASKLLIIPAWDKQSNINAILDQIQASKAHLAVWESFGSFVDAPAQGHQVKAFLSRMADFCRRYDKTIWGVVESPKMKPYEKYENPRQRISGAAAWGHFGETIFLVEQDNFERPDDPYRTLHVCARNAPTMKFQLAFDLQGRLLPVQEESVEAVVQRRAKKHS